MEPGIFWKAFGCSLYGEPIYLCTQLEAHAERGKGMCYLLKSQWNMDYGTWNLLEECSLHGELDYLHVSIIEYIVLYKNIQRDPYGK